MPVTTRPSVSIDLPNHSPAHVAMIPPAPVGFLSRPHILEATEACFAETGYDGVTIRAIAGRLGCSVGSIYRYFADKTELMIACCDRIFTPVTRELEIGAPVEQTMRVYARQASLHDEMYRLLFFLAARRGGMPSSVGAILDAWAERLGSVQGARRAWAQLHGRLMLGDTELEHSPLSAAPPAATDAQLPAAPRVQAVIVPAPAGAEAEDMTLL